jgi:hypothetical protein
MFKVWINCWRLLYTGKIMNYWIKKRFRGSWRRRRIPQKE